MANEGSFCRLSENVNEWRVNPENREILLSSLGSKSLEKSDPLFLQDEEVRNLHFICRGIVKQEKINYSGKNTIIKIYGPGNFIDISSAFSENNYSFSCFALEKTCVHFLDKKLFVKNFREEFRFQEMLLKQLCEDELNYKNELSSCWGLPGRQNLASLLVSLSRDFGTDKDKNAVELDIQLSRAELAELCGMTTEGLIRHLSTLKKEGVVENSEGKKLLIRDFTRLREIIRD